MTTGIMEAVTNVDHAVAAALSSRHHPHISSATKSTRHLRVQTAILMPVREALKNLQDSHDGRHRGLCSCVCLCMRMRLATACMSPKKADCCL